MLSLQRLAGEEIMLVMGPDTVYLVPREFASAGARRVRPACVVPIVSVMCMTWLICLS